MSNSKIRVAIADDHRLYLDALANAINNDPSYHVTIKACNGQDLMDQLSMNLSPAIILLDISMPVMNGLETMPLLKKKMPGVKVLAISGYSGDFDIVQMQRLGACGFLSKRAGAAEITEALNVVLEKGSYYSGYDLLAPGHAEPALEKLQSLSNKEMTFLKHACTDLKYKQIAEKMNVSRYTIDDYRNALFEKLNVNTRAALILMAAKYKIVDPAGFLPIE